MSFSAGGVPQEEQKAKDSRGLASSGSLAKPWRYTTPLLSVSL